MCMYMASWATCFLYRERGREGGREGVVCVCQYYTHTPHSNSCRHLSSTLSRVMGIVVFNPGSRVRAVARQLSY